MWRRCDLHNHTVPNEQCTAEWDAHRFVESCLHAGLDVVAVTDHDHIDHVSAALEAATDSALTIVPGVELSTDRGHLLVLSPDADGLDVLANFLDRVGVVPRSQVRLEDVLTAATTFRQRGGSPYLGKLILIGAHVDVAGSLLGTPNAMDVELQHRIASRLHALEVLRDETLREWTAGGVKQGPYCTLIQGSDTHDPDDRISRRTWLYLPEVDAASLRHAFALREASVLLSDPAPSPPAYCIESVTFSGGGHHDGQTFAFCERTNALIGPPNAGKSFVVDALRFVFDLPSDLDEVRATSAARLNSCLPTGATVDVRVRTPAGVVSVVRQQGGRAPSAPFRPIIFGQTELTRRANASSPALGLLDIHCPEVGALKEDVMRVEADLAARFREVLDLAHSARTLRESVDNPVDGLDAKRRELGTLAGAEHVADLAIAATRADTWRADAVTAIERWQEEVGALRPRFPPEPGGFAPPIDLARFLPRAALGDQANLAVSQIATRAAELAGDMMKLVTDEAADFDELKNSIDSQLADVGFVEGSDVHHTLSTLRRRIQDLELELAEALQIEREIEDGLGELRRLQARARLAHEALTAARRSTCSRVNSSMRSFFSSLTPDGDTSRLDLLIDDLKRGTRIRESTRQELREQLDRFAVLELAVRLTQGTTVVDETRSDQDRVVAEALGRSRADDLCRLSCLWPDDQLSLSKKPAPGQPPVPFHELTEGLRALAIKEISFAASELPVITDQPEDAVPTRAVFESLVPTLREQRRVRQFIVVSHDANIVVASDIDHVWVLEANDDGTAHSGSLSDSRVRQAALEHLEGGDAAFQLRAERYADLRSNESPSPPTTSNQARSL